MADDKSNEDMIDLMFEQFNANGIATAQVADGRVLMIKRSFMENLLSKYPDKKEFQIIIQTRGFEN